MVKKTYTASDIEILKGIEPVQKRPGMYTDTTNPNHLLQEVIDNCVDESIAGYCNNIDITLNDNIRYEELFSFINLKINISSVTIYNCRFIYFNH